MIKASNNSVSFQKITYDPKDIQALNRSSGFLLGTGIDKYVKDTEGKDNVRSLVADSTRFEAEIIPDGEDKYVRVHLIDKNKGYMFANITVANNTENMFTKVIHPVKGATNLPLVESTSQLINLIDKTVKQYIFDSIDYKQGISREEDSQEGKNLVLVQALRELKSIFNTES